MAHIVVLGGGIGGLSVVYELKEFLRNEDRITLVSNKPFFQFTPSNPWVAVSWRKKKDITVELAPLMKKHGVGFSDVGVKQLMPEENKIELFDGVAQMVHPDHILEPGETLATFEPVYPLVAGITQRQVQKAVTGALARLPPVPEWIDGPLLAREGWPG
ncbi:MAG TPA: hypothetical protein PLJ34_10685, partial [Hyphomicrobiales bacterium]|nr:hypothetical protein [Hyphomicrobiales bacterium]